MVKLVVHIGLGKTGSSSIQETLLHNAPILERQGVKYLGMMLENSDAGTKLPWQRMSGSNAFFDGMSASDASEQLYDVLNRSISDLRQDGYSLAIWSNEWLATRGAHVCSALKKIKESGTDVEIQCYVRRHDRWIQSAYLQWGIKDKSYEGPVRSFDKWLEEFGQRDISFAPSLHFWDDLFGNRLRVFNYDSAGDVVDHFLRSNGISGASSIKENVTPDQVLLAAQSVFNGRKKRRMPPTEFGPISRLVTGTDENGAVLPPLDRLTPSVGSLQEIVASRRDDIEDVNRFLLRSGEPSLSFASPVSQQAHPTPWEMDQWILKLVYSLAEETVRLRKQTDSLRAQLVALQDHKAI
ncbi:MAG: hypothetical protein KF694_05135 [Mesorhizobium sp.]|nr:hypothetical protein [Mesorhizobium sp.]